MTFVYRLGWLFFRLLYSTYLPTRFLHADRVPLNGGVILCANHASFLDPPVVGTGLTRQCSFLARDTLFRFAASRWLLTRWHAIPVDRDGSSASGLKNILAALGREEAVVLFPEGTRTRDGQLQRARSGVGLIAIRSEAPVVPVRIWGTFDAYGKHVPFPKPTRLIVKYGQPLEFKALREEARRCSKERLKQIYQEVAEQIMAEIAQLEPTSDRET